ncbi:SDR family NAD(P)-dependent oxidoreductase [uncultured Stenotrophomonas sp.]|uniref:SDR family NAD(P)-dependent oxidoreductase n=1 Tax=uncultured Stenotrophomonas sp. TaxID=165438 RepID=UPI0025CCC60D|nr:SDR family NAD(P)-dependent oxidoreductase [uncultured Stenotrophomonas sp.]
MARFPELQGKVALITGAGRRAGLGEGIARRLLQEGCKVVLTDIGQVRGAEMPVTAVGTDEELAQVAAELAASSGGECVAMALDVLEEAQVEAVVKATVERFGRLDILVNNAGIGYLMKSLVDIDAREWDAVLGVNLRGAFLAIKHAGRQMIAQGGGRIVNIASQAAKSAFPHAAAYCSSKHGLVGLTRVAALELGAHGINVNAVCPNHVTTGLGAWQNEYFAEKQGKSVEQYLADMRARIPAGRPGLPSDTAAATAFLCSDDAVYITGEAINVSGGEENH